MGHPARHIFGTEDPGAIDAMVEAFVQRHLGVPVNRPFFCHSSVGSTHGLVLDDGRKVVLKARPHARSNPDLPLDRASLEQVIRVQRHLHERGYPAPEPLVGPRPMGRRAPFSPQEHRAVRAWAVYWIAYGAWLYVERGQTHWPTDSWPTLLAEHGETLLHETVLH